MVPKQILPVRPILACACILAFSTCALPQGTRAPDVSAAIKRLKSPLAPERVAGAVDLNSLGDKAVSAIPELMSLLEDRVPVEIIVSSGDKATIRYTTSAGEQATAALGSIGKPALDALLSGVKTDRGYRYWFLVAIDAHPLADDATVIPLMINAYGSVLTPENYAESLPRDTIIKRAGKSGLRFFENDKSAAQAWWEKNKDRFPRK